jgi:predicted metal-dependent enzyme (double-stranded beta helix superfamily)
MSTTQAMPSTTWSPEHLLCFLESYVAEHAVRIPRPDPHQATRSYSLLELSDDLEVWAINWPTDQGLALHDHGGSAGALWVVAGALSEVALDRSGRRARRHIAAGQGTSFGPTHIHDVVNRHPAAATSIHAYAPPMTSMTYYRAEGATLRADRTEYRADPSWNP